MFVKVDNGVSIQSNFNLVMDGTDVVAKIIEFFEIKYFGGSISYLRDRDAIGNIR